MNKREFVKRFMGKNFMLFLPCFVYFIYWNKNVGGNSGIVHTIMYINFPRIKGFIQFSKTIPSKILLFHEIRVVCSFSANALIFFFDFRWAHFFVVILVMCVKTREACNCPWITWKLYVEDNKLLNRYLFIFF